MNIDPRTLTAAELARIAAAEVHNGLDRVWQEELVKRLAECLAKRR